MQVCIHDTKIRRLTEMPYIKLYVNLRKYDGYQKWAIIVAFYLRDDPFKQQQIIRPVG